MSIYLHNNLKALVNAFPDLVDKIYQPQKEYCLFLARSGHYTVRLNRGNKLLHSLIDPIREAERFVEEQDIHTEEKVILFGFGLGYHVRGILKRARHLKSLIIVELNPEIMKAALEASDISDIINDSRVSMVLPETDQSFIMLLDSEFRQIHQNLKVVLHTPSIQTYRERFPLAYGILEMFKVRRLNSQRNQQLLVDNFYANMPRLQRDKGVLELFNRFPEMPVALVGAGPSLDEDLPVLRRMRENSLVIAVNSVVRKLQKEKIRPDFVVVMDPSPRIVVDLQGFRYRQVPLVYVATASPEFVEHYPGERFAAYAEFGPQEEEFTETYPRGELSSGFGTVMGTALDLAIRVGGNPIYLFGTDLSYGEERRYSNDVDRDQEQVIRRLFDVEQFTSSNGKPGFTTPGLRYSRKSLEAYIQRARTDRPELEIYNVSQTGVDIRGTLRYREQVKA